MNTRHGRLAYAVNAAHATWLADPSPDHAAAYDTARRAYVSAQFDPAQPDEITPLSSTGAVRRVTVTQADGAEYRAIVREGTPDEVTALITAIVSRNATFQIEEIPT